MGVQKLLKMVELISSIESPTVEIKKSKMEFT